MKAGNDIKTFLNFIKNEKYWKYFEVRACALKDNKAFLDMVSKFQESVQLDRVYYFSPLLALTDDFINNQILEQNLVQNFRETDRTENIIISFLDH